MYCIAGINYWSLHYWFKFYRLPLWMQDSATNSTLKRTMSSNGNYLLKFNWLVWLLCSVI